MIRIIEVKTPRRMREFARFPLRLYKNCPHYVPALYADERGILNPAKNPSLSACEVKCWLAEKDGKVVGRVAAILQKKYNEIAGRRCMRFSRFDCIDDEEVAASLLGAVEAFARASGMDTVHGPWGFNDQDREGLLTVGFDRRATYATNYNYPYYERLVRACGYTDESEWVEYDFKVPEEVDGRIATVAEFVRRKLGLQEIAETAPMRKLIPVYGPKALAMVNEAYAGLDCYVPVEGKVVDQILRQFATVINPRYFSMLADKNGEVAAMAVMLPSICGPLQKSGGRMPPLTLLRLMKAISSPKELEMVLIAVRPDYQKRGVNSVMMARILRNIIDDKIEKVESNPELVTNIAVQEQWNVLEREIVKRRKTFVKTLA